MVNSLLLTLVLIGAAWWVFRDHTPVSTKVVDVIGACAAIGTLAFYLL